ncbi:hypothetical protein M5D96_002870, partial [Drosophila gunungcola]
RRLKPRMGLAQGQSLCCADGLFSVHFIGQGKSPINGRRPSSKAPLAFAFYVVLAGFVFVYVFVDFSIRFIDRRNIYQYARPHSGFPLTPVFFTISLFHPEKPPNGESLLGADARAGKRNVPSPARVLMMESVPLCWHKTTAKIGEKITKTSVREDRKKTQIQWTM